MCFSNDSRWVAVSTLNGTTHVFPITPYGGDITVRTHTSSRVVNQLSRFHTSAGIEAFPSTSSSSSSHSSRSTAGSGKGSSQGQSQSPPREAKDVSTSSSVINYGSAATHSWSNPRDLPLPSPITVSALQQIKQPYLATTGWYTGYVRVACFWNTLFPCPLCSFPSPPTLFPLSSHSHPPLLPLSSPSPLPLLPFSFPSSPSPPPLLPFSVLACCIL